MKNETEQLFNASVFTPDNEPYLGRETVYAFDNLIVACMEANTRVAPITHEINKTDLQEAACQLIPQSISIALSIRELVRQGYLFGAFILIRPLVERATILLYLKRNPHDINIWNRGWQHNEAPSLARMLNEIASEKFTGIGPDFTKPFNSILHGKPDSAIWSLTPISGEKMGHSASKSLNNSALCDDVCIQSAAWLTVVVAMMSAYFPDHFLE